MIETVVNLRPRELWPKRKLEFADALKQTENILSRMEDRSWIRRGAKEERDKLLNKAAMEVTARFDRGMANYTLKKYQEFEKQLAPHLKKLNWEIFDFAANFFLPRGRR